MSLFERIKDEPFRLFFPLGIMFLLWGILIWVPLIWTADSYPILAHRYLLLNGFAGCFIAGFLMTAVPRFSQTFKARAVEIFAFLIVTLTGIIPAYFGEEKLVFMASSLQPAIILLFLFSRIHKRKENPPFSFVFIFVGLILWLFSGVMSIFFDAESFRHLHHEGAIAAIILGVGSRLIPGILGHVEIVSSQKKIYEKAVPIIFTVPKLFWLTMISFVGSYFVDGQVGSFIRVLCLTYISFRYWNLYKFPKERSSLTWSIWFSAWLIVLSFVLKALWSDGMIHASHSFFINGIVLMTLMVATRVIQSHGPKDKSLEHKKVLLLVSFLIFTASLTRISAFLMPESYLRHLAYSSIVLASATLIWSYHYLKYVFTRIRA